MKKVNIWKYESVAAFAAEIENRPTLPAWKSHEEGRQESPSRTKFTGTKTFAEALNLLKYGDADNAKKITTCMAADGIKSKHTITQFKPAVVGSLPHVPNYVRNTPKSMMAINRRVMQAPTKIISLHIDTSIGYEISAEKIVIAGAQIASAVASLERSGYRVNLFADVFSEDSETKGKPIYYVVSVKVKDAATPLNVLNIAFPLIHPSFLRRCYFRFLETHTNDYVFGYGYSCTADKIKSIYKDGTFLRLQDVIRYDLSASDIIASLQR